MTMRRPTLALMFLGFVLTGAESYGESYSVSLLSVGSASSNTFATAVNAAGEVVGYSSSSSGQSAIAWSPGGVATTLKQLGGNNSQANAINASGQIVGSSVVGIDIPTHAVLWSNGSIKDLGAMPNGQNAALLGINDSGLMVGQSTNGRPYPIIYTNNKLQFMSGFTQSTGGGAFGVNAVGEVAGLYLIGYSSQEAMSWQNGKVTNPSPSPYTTSDAAAYAINNAGEIVGLSSFNESYQTAALWSKGGITKLGVLPGNLTSVALAINNHGAIVGWSNDGAYSIGGTATLWSNGTIKNLNNFLTSSLRAAGWSLYAATGINDSGKIVGNAYNFTTHVNSAFVAVAEPDAPSITSLQPNLTDAGSAAFTLTVNGSNFVSGEIVEWNGVSLATTFVSATKLTAKVTATEVGEAGSAAVTVVDTALASVKSKPALFTIPLTSIAIASETIKAVTGGYSITVVLHNSGFKPAADMSLSGAYLATSASLSTLPIDVPSILPNGSKTLTLAFPSTAGKAGEEEFLLLYGSYTGGAFTLNSIETLP